jgi:dipeptidyl aminopeptidase/acylaminoacyl peptidase
MNRSRFLTRWLVILIALPIVLMGCNSVQMLIETGREFTLRNRPVDVEGCRLDRIFYDNDGIRIAAWIIRPRGEGPFPLVVLNHGYFTGNIAEWNLDSVRSPFMALACKLARRQYAVFFSHYRGFGESEGEQTFGPGEVSDVSTGIDLMKSLPFVDPSRIALVGDSEGAMISLFVASMREDIRCVASVSAPVELLRMFETMPAWKRKLAALPGLYDTIGGTYDEVPEEYLKRSVLYSASDINCPILIIHGARDPVVPVEQAFLLEEVLLGAGISHSLHVLPQATHGILTERNESGVSDVVRNLVFGFLATHMRADGV